MSRIFGIDLKPVIVDHPERSAEIKMFFEDTNPYLVIGVITKEELIELGDIEDEIPSDEERYRDLIKQFTDDIFQMGISEPLKALLHAMVPDYYEK